MKKYKLTVVTVTYKPKHDELIEFINSYRRYNDLEEDARLIIVDNSPEDYEDVKHVCSNYEEVDYVPNPSNPGFGASNNKGFHMYESDYVLFINNDVEFLESVFKPIIKIFEADSSIACIGISQKGGAPSYFNNIKAPSDCKPSDPFDERYHFISGAFMFFRSDYFKRIGEFDEELFMFLEEFDLSERVIAAGLHTVYCDKFKFLHKVGNRRLQSVRNGAIGSLSLKHICEKYDIDMKPIVRTSIIRLFKLQIYFLLQFNFKQVKNIFLIIKEKIQYI